MHILNIIHKIKTHQFPNIHGIVSEDDTWGIGLTIDSHFDDSIFSFDPIFQQSIISALNIIPSLTPNDSTCPQLMLDYMNSN